MRIINYKAISFLALFAFLTLQISASIHAVEHGFKEKHSSDIKCETCTLAKNISAATNNFSTNINLIEYSLNYNILTREINVSFLNNINSARSPPSLLS